MNNQTATSDHRRTMRPYVNLSDYLFEYADQLDAYHGPSPNANFGWDYSDLNPEIECVKAVMLALTSGLDSSHDTREVFAAQLAEAVSRYTQAMR